MKKKEKINKKYDNFQFELNKMSRFNKNQSRKQTNKQTKQKI